MLVPTIRVVYKHTFPMLFFLTIAIVGGERGVADGGRVGSVLLTPRGFYNQGVRSLGNLSFLMLIKNA